MRKFKICVLGLCLLAILSCNNADKEFLNVGKDGETSIECSNLDQIVEIPIESSGSWVALLPEDCDWITILTPEGRNGVLRLVVDINNSSKDYMAVKRATTVTVKSGDQTCAIELTQFVGASANDPGSNSDESILIATKGVGAGFDLMSDKTKSQIFNVNVIETFKDDDIRHAFKVFPSVSQSAQIQRFDSMECKKDSLDVVLSIVVSYGFFSLDMRGKYESNEKKVTANFTYGQVAMLPREEARLEVLDLIAMYEENEELKSKTKEKEANTKYNKSIEGIFTVGFKGVFNKVKGAHAIKKDNYPKFKNAVADLVKKYGVVAITGATLGGQTSMNVKTDTTEIKTDHLHIGGSVSLAIGALISINGKFDAEYDKIGTEILKKSLISSFVQGGSDEASINISNALQSSASEMSSKKIRDAVAAWEKTVVYNKNGKLNRTEVIEYQFTGIWNLFPYNMQEDVRSVVIELSKNNKTMLNIEKLQLKKPSKT